jgi:hypothetical protein
MTSLKKLLAVLAVSLPLAASAQTTAAVGGLNLKFSGDFNTRFMVFTDQAGIYSGAETIVAAPSATNPFAGRTSEDTVEEAWGEFKFRFTVEAASSDNAVRGVYGVEIGAIRFGDGGTITGGTPADPIGTRGGGFSGDGDNYETRFAYIDFGLDTAHKNRISVGLQPFTVNRFIWSETATGVQLKGDAGVLKYTAAWMRGREVFTTQTEQEVTADGDNYLLRADFVPMKDAKVGVFGLYQHQNPEVAGATFGHLLKRVGANTSFDLVSVGADAGLTFGNIFVNGDFIYQMGELEGGIDHSAWIAHADVGVNLDALKLTYTGWYASGQPDDEEDSKAFIATDVDFFDSIVLFEGGFTDDVYFTEAPYFLNFGAIFNRLGADYKVSPKVTVGAAAMYIMTAEDVPVGNGENVIGTEFDAYLSYKPVPQLELAVNAGYLVAGDALAAIELDGDDNADNDIFRMTARARYMF